MNHENLTRDRFRSIAQCRAVCRAWRSAISDPSFDAAHARRPPVVATVKRNRDYNATLVFGPFPGRWHRDPNPNPGPPSNRAPCLGLAPWSACWFSVRGSWDGVVCIEGRRISFLPPCTTTHAERYVLWNPLTMACAAVSPPDDRAQFIGAYAHPATRRFHLLLASGETDGLQLMAPAIFRLLRVGDAVWREIPLDVLQDAQLQPASKISMPTKTLNCVTLHGSLHGLVLSASGILRVLAFDTTREKLRWMEAPPNVRQQGPTDLITNARLGVLSAGDLCAFVVDPSTGTMDMWVLGGSCWRLKKRISLVVQDEYRRSDLSRKSFWHSTMVDVVVGAEEGEEVVLHRNYGKIFGCYNLGRMEWQRVSFDRPGLAAACESLLTHRESVLQHQVSFGEASRTLSRQVGQDGQRRYCLQV